MTEPFVGQIMLFAGNYAARGWAFCHGQLLPIAQYQALFAIIGTTYGGDGRVSFALPDLRGRVPVSAGQAPGLSNYVLGDKLGDEAVTLTQAQIPAHSHLVTVSDAQGTQVAAAGAFLANTSDANNRPLKTHNPAPAQSVVLNPGTIQSTGGSQPHENRQPTLVLNYLIALQGLFPARN
ncbi:Tail Collar domain protein [Methylobacterium sp. 4-46]|uniref:phage tail protein n=1 Tax=unclassified Methylobacterium TaxID=2615210 RepID=UPI000152CEB8|nr:MULTISPECIES: tail fiber protein [Methylobacterium]ACA17875.1 Tail Collar domain protein [Methylobacterium sp. 4-46]WFT77176.1 tail fiber protein [Methylobacterium nodulans]